MGVADERNKKMTKVFLGTFIILNIIGFLGHFITASKTPYFGFGSFGGFALVEIIFLCFSFFVLFIYGFYINNK